jgi:hypothetical protein
MHVDGFHDGVDVEVQLTAQEAVRLANHLLTAAELVGEGNRSA